MTTCRTQTLLFLLPATAPAVVVVSSSLVAGARTEVLDLGKASFVFENVALHGVVMPPVAVLYAEPSGERWVPVPVAEAGKGDWGMCRRRGVRPEEVEEVGFAKGEGGMIMCGD